MNYIYCTHIKNLNWSHIQSQKKILDKDGQRDIDKYKFEQDKCRSLLGKMLLLYILKKHENYQENILPKITYNAYRKPMIDIIKGSFNISHSNDWIVCAYSKQEEIGIDIEKKTLINIHDYRAVMTENEYDRFTKDRNYNFFQLWTLKEAIMKAEGSGFFLAPTSFELPYPFNNNDKIYIKNKRWFLHSQNFDKSYIISLASLSPIMGQLKNSVLSLEKLLV